MGPRARVSVVVPVHNGRDTIEECVLALLDQDYPTELTELLIVDSHSDDGTPDVIARYPVTLLAEREIRTSYAARNRGVLQASGEIVAFTDADCVPARDWLRRLVTAFEDETIAVVAGTVDDAPPRSLCEEFTARVKPFARPEQGGLTTLLTVNAAVRRDALESVGFFDERLPTAGDVDLGWRLQEQGFRIGEASEARVAHRHRSTLRKVFAQYRRYGLSTMLLTTLHRGDASSPLKNHLRTMASQVRAIITALLALAFRCGVSIFRGFDRRYVLWPVFLVTIESGNLLGKIEGLFLTLGCRRNPFPNGRLGRS